MEMAKVYHFTRFDIQSGKNVRSKRPATREAIIVVGGAIDEDSEKEVPVSEIDGNGFWIGQ